MVDTKLIDKLKIANGEKLYINDYLILSSISLFFFKLFTRHSLPTIYFTSQCKSLQLQQLVIKRVFVYNKINKTCTIRYFKICSKNGQLLVNKTKQTTSTSLYVSERQHPCSFRE